MGSVGASGGRLLQPRSLSGRHAICAAWSTVMKLPHRRQFLHLAAGAAVLPAISSVARAQAYPTRPISIIIAFPPGTNTEGILRFLAERLSLSLGPPVIIENRPGGAGGSVATASVARPAPDGHIRLASPPGTLVVAPMIYRNLGYDPAKAFTPIATLMSIPQMLVVNPTVPAKSMQE